MNDATESSKIKKYFKEDKEHNRAEFIAAIIVNIILWYIVNNLLNWNLGFISPSFIDVLWIINYFLYAAIIINFIFIFYHPGWFRNLLQIPLDILGLIAAYNIFVVFPFILNDLLALGLRILIILIMIGLFIAIIVHFIKFIFGILDR